jgi:hypothetical protein
MRRAKLELIEHLLSGPQAREIKGRGWILRTDLGTKDVNVITGALEQAGRAFDIAFPGVPQLPASDVVTIVAFRDGLSQAQVDSFDNLRPVKYGAAGKYSSDEKIIYGAKGSRPTPALSELFVHEAAHHLIRRRLFQGKDPPTWVNEGIATFLECLKEADGGELDLTGYERARVGGGFTLWERPAVEYLRELKQAAKKESLPPLAVLLGRESFNGDDSDLMYGTSWLFVHYLINAEGGRWRAPFQAWMQKFAAEEKEPDLAPALGVPVVQLYSALPAYLQSLK